MRAITIEREKTEVTPRLEDIPEPDPQGRLGARGSRRCRRLLCGTDVEIVEGKYGWAPPGEARLVLGHESLGRVVNPGPRGTLQEGDLVAGIVRRPDPVPCSNCAVGEWDMCRNGQYTERGIEPNCTGSCRSTGASSPSTFVKVDSSLGLLGVLLRAARDGRREGVGTDCCGWPTCLFGSRGPCW